ncbi:hypothetical protein [Haloactinopolyspora sp.]|uniref:hypothetical protein n=1 Tax=Haloactinopolyspora sp. TaxID=1966353 RepID=UPI002632EBBF|nr:hypothetical protein [Haloactinopolyspora sp.]
MAVRLRTSVIVLTVLATVTGAAGLAASDDQPVADAVAAEPTTAAEERAPWASPLTSFLGLGPEAAAEHMSAGEQKIAACMQAAGFEYTPAVPETADVLPGELTSFADASEYGYGLTINRSADEMPNREAYEALSARERERWDDALYGPAADGTGCLNEAGIVLPEQALERELSRPEFRNLAAGMAELETAITTHERVTRAVSAWSACMAEQDFPGLDAPGDGFELVLERAGQTVGADVAVDGFDTAWLDRLSDAELAELQEFERAVARADIRCLADYDAVEREIRTDLENEFIAGHRDELASLRSAMEQHG